LEESLTAEWSKQLFRSFLEDAGLRTNPGPVSQLARRNIGGFQLLDSSLRDELDLSVRSVLLALSGDTSNRLFRGLKNWLATARGLDLDGEEAEWFRHERLADRLIASAPCEWIRAALVDFRAFLYQRRAKYQKAGVLRGPVPLSPKSLDLALKYALWLLNHAREAGASSMPGLTQEIVDSYAAKRSKVFRGLGSFIRFANATSHRLNTLELPTSAAPRSSLVHKMDPGVRASAVRAWLEAVEPTEVRNASIALLCVFYAQHPDKVTRLAKSAVLEVGELVEVDFGQGSVEIDPDVSRVLNRWLLAWFTPSRFAFEGVDDRLYPGARAGRTYSTRAFNAWLKSKYGIHSRQLFSTAVHGLLEAGLDDPGVLVYGLGLSPGTAIKYWKDSGRHLSSFFFDEAIEALREEGLLGDVREN
jgi:hypothetical protein